MPTNSWCVAGFRSNMVCQIKSYRQGNSRQKRNTLFLLTLEQKGIGSDMASSMIAETGNSSALPALSRQRLADQIADVLREQMLTGTLKPGDPIHERDTSEALGVSRTPLRESLLILEAEGLVEMAPARSPIVAAPTLAELTQLLVVQSTLEALAGELACENATEEQIGQIADLHQIMLDSDSSPDTVAHFKTDMAFHEAIVAATGNQPLVKTHKQYNSRLWRARYMSSSRRVGRACSMAQHGAIVEGLKNRDSAGTSAIMRQHLENAIKSITQIYQAEGLAERD